MIDLRLSTLVIFHPMDAFAQIKRNKDHFKLLPVILMFVLTVISRYIFIITVHEPLADIRIVDTNLLLEIGRMVIPLVTWMVSIYGLSSVMSGETKFSEIVTTSAYCLTPYILLTPFIILLSRLLSLEELGLFAAIQNVMFAWIIALLFVSVMTMNNYSFLKTLFICFISLIGMVLIWAVLLMIFALSFQIVNFAKELLYEFELLNR